MTGQFTPEEEEQIRTILQAIFVVPQGDVVPVPTEDDINTAERVWKYLQIKDHFADIIHQCWPGPLPPGPITPAYGRVLDLLRDSLGYPKPVR
jgi:hypothetical protein